MSNIYGRRINAHFHCGHNISQDPQLLLTIKSISGLKLSALSEKDKETAAKAIGAGYIKKDGDMLYPKILVSESVSIYNDIISDFISETDDLTGPVADELYKNIKKFVPKHMKNEYQLFIHMTSCGLLDVMIEKCILNGTLIPPEHRIGVEGVIMAVKQ